MEPTINLENTGPQQLRWKALELLARREHSRLELLVKLSRRYPESFELVEQVVERLSSEGLQSDHRFAEAYVAMRKRRGYGPVRIRMELKERGIDRDLITSELAKPEHDWYALVVEVWRKKFYQIDAKSADKVDELARLADQHELMEVDTPSIAKLAARQKSRQIRFLQYRGFAIEHIRAAIT